MKKYLLLLVFAISTATCFALPSRPVASVQERSDELPSDETIAEMLGCLRERYEMLSDLYYAIMTKIEESGDVYFESVGGWKEKLYELSVEAKEVLEQYYSGGKYIGGISTSDEINRILQLISEIEMMPDVLFHMMEAHIAMYQELFVPFKTGYDESLNAFKECETILREQYGVTGNEFGYEFDVALNALDETFGILFSDAEKAMCDGMSFSELIGEFNERLAGAIACVERLNNIGDVTYREQNAYDEALKTLESEYPDVFDYFIKYFQAIDSKFNDALSDVKDIIYNQEQTDTYITTVEELIEEISFRVTKAREAQKRYEDCAAALEQARKAIEEAWATILAECPDVYDNYKPTFDGFSSELDGIGRGLSGAFQSQDAADSFMQSLNDIVMCAGETVGNAKNEQNGTTGVAGVEAVGNDDAEYYDLNGAKVTDPRPGTIVIKVDANGKTTKVVVR